MSDLSRREFLLQSAMTGSSLWVLLNAPRPRALQAAAASSTRQVLSEAEWKTVQAITGRIIPTDHEPGAIDKWDAQFYSLPTERSAMKGFMHFHGTCRMGDDPKKSALNKFNQMHEVKNVFVVDGSSFPNASEKNPTLTILAISWRATDYLADQIQAGAL